MTRHRADDLAIPSEVFHQLAGQLDGVPLEAVCPSNRRTIDQSEQVVQAMTGLMQERDDVGVGQEGRARLVERREVADEIGNRRRAVGQPRPSLRHPRPPALALARVQIEVQPRDRGAGTVDHVQEPCIGVPQLYVIPLHEADAEQPIQ